MLPMGTIMMVTMFVIVLALSRFPKGGINARLPGGVEQAVGWLALAAGCWNALWHGLRHLDDPWGLMALGSGLLMLCCAALVLLPHRLPQWVHRGRAPVLIALLVFAVAYALKIRSL